MKFKARIKDVGTNHSWTEEFSIASVITEAQAKEYAEGAIQSFNNSLRKGELSRELLEVTIEEPAEAYPHGWEKSNLVTIIEEGSRPYDTYYCTRCEATGKRYGLDPYIVPDKGFTKMCKGD